MTQATSKRILFATGGSGGHIYPALAVAEQAKEQGFNCHFLGHANGMEANIVSDSGFAFTGVAAGKWDRSSPNPLEILKVIRGLIEAIRVLRKLEPDLVIGFGGFASFPGVAAARLLAKPFILHEGNVFPGKVTKWFASAASFVMAADSAAYKHLPANLEQHVVGYPIREKRVDQREARRVLELPRDALVTLVMGGSQGSLILNKHVPNAYRELKKADQTSALSSLAVLHSSGRERLSELDHSEGLVDYFTTDFVNATLAWSAADLAITRAGFGTLAEAAFHGVPCIMVPLPTSAENHQLHNARAVETAGAGWVVEEAQIESLTKVWQEAVNKLDKAKLAARNRSPEGAAQNIMALIQNLFLASESPSTLKEAL